MKIAGKIAKWIVVGFVAVFNLMFIFRCCVAADQSRLSDIVPTEALRAAYADGEIAIVTHDVVREISENGYMSAYAYVYSPEAKELQVTVRYNNSVYEYNGLTPGSPFTYTLHDTVSEAVWEPTRIVEDSMWMYNYRRLVFSDVEFSDTSDLIVRMHCAGEEISFETVHFADQNAVTEPYKLSGSEKKALGGE